MTEWTPTLELRRYDDTEKLTGPRLQQQWYRVVGHPYAVREYEWRDVPLVWEPGGRPRLPHPATSAEQTQAGCICQDQHRRGYCTEPGCPYNLEQK